MKKHFTLLLMLCAATNLLAYDFMVDDLYYNIIAENAVEVTYGNDKASNCYDDLETIEIPSSVLYNGVTYDVVGIGNNAFEQCYGLVDMIIPDGIKYIADYAFHVCYSLYEVNLPNSLETIGKGAFQQCDIISITIPNSTTSIGEGAFKDCLLLLDVNLGSGITSINPRTFEGCGSLEFITLPDSLTTIDHGAFWDCYSLSSIEIPQHVDSIGNRAFCNCESLSSITIPSGATKIGEGILEGCTGLTDVIIEAELISIPNQMFSNCSMLSLIDIPNSVTYIGDEAFMGCSSLLTINIPDKVTTLGYSVFEDCSSLDFVSIGNSVKNFGWSTFWGCTSLTSVEWNAIKCDDFTSNDAPFLDINEQILSFTFGDSVKHIPANLCNMMTSLNSVTISEGLLSIGEYAFAECTSLTSIDLPESLTTIKYGAFMYSSALKNITIADNVTSIETCAFSGTKYYLNPLNWKKGVLYIGNYLIEASTIVVGKYTVNEGTKLIANNAFTNTLYLTSIVLPSSLTHIGDSAFYYCTSIASIEVQAMEPPVVGIYALEEIDRSIPVIVPEQSLDAYRQADVWKEFLDLQGDETSTNVGHTIIQTSNTKFVRDGQLLIMHQGNTYNMQGILLTQ